jgi:hypothetical protein
MAINLGSAYGKVGLDASGVKNGVATATGGLKDLQKTGIAVGRALQDVGRAMTIGVSLPLIALGGASVKLASDLEESKNKVAVVFGEMSDSVLEWSDKSAQAFGTSRRNALEAVGTFGNLFSTMGLTTQQSSEMSIKLVELAGDLASFNNIDPTVALEKLRSGLVGEVEPLRALGINLLATTVQAKAMEMGLADAGGEISQAALAQARYTLILEQTKNAQGDFARTSDGVANSTRIMRAEMEDAMATFGARLLPITLRVVQAVTKLVEVFGNLPVPVQDALLILGGLLILMGPIIGFLGTLISMVSAIVPLITALGTAGVSLAGVGTALTGVGAAVGGVVAAIATVALPILLIIGTLALLYLAFKTNFGGIRTTAEQLWFIIKWAFGMILATIADAAKTIASYFGQIIVDGDYLNDWLTHFPESWRRMVEYIGRLMALLRDYIIRVFRMDWGALGRAVIIGLISGFLSGVANLVAAAQKAAQSVLDTIKKTLGIHSPSMEAFKLGQMTGEGYALGMARGIDPRAIARMVARPVQQMSSSRQQNLTVNLGGGLSMQQASMLIADSEERILGVLQTALGGA